MDSPAMDAGIQSGDVIVQIGTTDIPSYQELIHQLLKLRPGAEVSMTLMRQGPEGYTPIEVMVTLGSQNKES